jgi:acyl-CoA synthetase (AMP-forming)/AMP-acid ligase II
VPPNYSELLSKGLKFCISLLFSFFSLEYFLERLGLLFDVSPCGPFPGDLGVMHPDGYLQLKDRSKDIIISGGENISSIEVESVLFKHPQILEASVVARYDDFWGETPCAFITLKNSATGSVTEQSIIEWCKQNMPRYMVPRSVVFGPLPKTSTGKVQKQILRQRVKMLGPSSRGRSKL